MPPPSLLHMALRCAQRHAASITDFAEIPYEMANPIIKKVESAQQLRELEINHPQWDFAEHWQAFIRRDIPEIGQDESKMVYPKNPASWHKVYRMLMRKQGTKEKEQEEELRKQLLGQKVQKAEKQALFVPSVMAHARDEKETNKFVDGVANKNTSSWQKSVPSVKNAKTGHDAIKAMRRQTASNSKQMRIAKPWQAPAQASRQIKQAPASMLREATRQTTQEFAPRELLPHEIEMLRERRRMNATVKIQAPGRVSNAKHAEAFQARNAAEVRKAKEIDEARLRQLTKTENAKWSSQTPAKRFEFSDPPPMPTTEAASPPSASPPPFVVPTTAGNGGRLVARSPSMSPPKQSSPSASPPRQPAGIRKRPATSIFAPKPKKVKH